MKIPYLSKIREMRGLTQDQLSALTDLSRGAIANYESGGGAKPENAERIARELGVQLADLVGGASSLQVMQDEETGYGVPYYDVDVFAGDVETYNDGPQTPVAFLRLPGIRDCDFSCRVSGDSMYEKIFPGSIIVCKELKNRDEVSFGDIYLVITDNNRWVKYLRKDYQSEGRWILRSHNREKHDDIPVYIDRVRRLYAVKMIVNQEQM